MASLSLRESLFNCGFWLIYLELKDSALLCRLLRDVLINNIADVFDENQQVLTE
jgi:hypothetical protein